MLKKQRQKLEKRLSRLNSGERRRLYKRAAQLRKAASRSLKKHRKSRRESKDNLAEDTPTFEKHRQRPQESLDEWVLKLLAEEHLPASDSVCETSVQGEFREGMVVWVGGGTCRVFEAEQEFFCKLRPSVATVQRTDLAVGDRVLISEQ